MSKASWPSPPVSWQSTLPAWCSEGRKGTPLELVEEITSLERKGRLCPPLHQIWRALELTSPEETRVVIIGQDPYHGLRQAHGLAFSVADPLLTWPPSLRNIFRERSIDLDIPMEREANLEDWAKQGVLLLNTALTTELGKAGAHRGMGWEEVILSVLVGVMRSRSKVVWVLWGRPAQALHARTMDHLGATREQDVCIKSAHPSPLSAYRGFLGSRPFGQINRTLQQWGESPIDW